MIPAWLTCLRRCLGGAEGPVAGTELVPCPGLPGAPSGRERGSAGEGRVGEGRGGEGRAKN